MQNIIFGLIGLLVGAGGVYLLLVSKLQHQLEGARRKLERAEQAGGDALDLQQQLQEAQARYQDLESRYQNQLAQTEPTDSPLTQELAELRQRLQQQEQDYQTQTAQFQAERDAYQQQITDLQSRLESKEESGQGNALMGGVAAAGLAGVAGWAANEFLSKETPAPTTETVEAPEVVENFAPAEEEARPAVSEAEISETVEEVAAPEAEAEPWANVATPEAPAVMEEAVEPSNWEPPALEDRAPEASADFADFTVAPEENWVDAAPTVTESSFEPPNWEMPEAPVEDVFAPESESAAAEITSPFTEESDNWVDTGDLGETPTSEALADFPELTVTEEGLGEAAEPAIFDLEDFGTSPLAAMEPEALFEDVASPVLEELPLSEESPLILEELSSADDALELPIDFLAEIPTDQPEVLVEEVRAVEEAEALPADFLADFPLDQAQGVELTEEIPSSGEELDFLMELQQSTPETEAADDLFAGFGEAPDDADIPGLDLFEENTEEMPELPISGADDNLADPFINILDTSVDTPDHELLELLQADNEPNPNALEGDFLDGLDDLFGEEKPTTRDDHDLDAFLSGPEAETNTGNTTDTMESLEELLASDPLSSEEWGLPSDPASEHPFQ
ncbi:hypothetical protein [Synechocystis sp. LKSZ1]|uniref:hypothetical protein n=1 Tax=Synechocystis sp. LKSZ1 TaxID=3144951 RepID=UPI00336BE23D